MKTILINCNTEGEVNIDDNARIDGISIALVNEKQIPVARYEISIKIMSGLTDLKYRANNCRIHFYGNDNIELTPSMIHEVVNSTNFKNMTDNKQLAKLEFVSFCIEQYKMVTKSTGRDVEQMFQQKGVIEFLLKHYEVLHTQGEQAILNEIDEYLKHH